MPRCRFSRSRSSVCCFCHVCESILARGQRDVIEEEVTGIAKRLVGHANGPGGNRPVEKPAQPTAEGSDPSNVERHVESRVNCRTQPSSQQ